jgi:hypothetical protein
MRVIIAGSRNIQDRKAVHRLLDQSKFDITEVVSGAAVGVDQFGEEWAMHNQIPIRRFHPNWKKHGKSAGVMRNVEMAEYADALIVIWNRKSPGSRNMIMVGEKKKLPMEVYELT